MQSLLCHSIGGLQVKRNDDLRTILIDEESSEVMAAFTQREYQIFLLLLEGELVNDNTFIKTLFNTSSSDTHTRKCLKRHIDKIKLKLRASTLNIRRVHLEGYMLVVCKSSSSLTS